MDKIINCIHNQNTVINQTNCGEIISRELNSYVEGAREISDYVNPNRIKKLYCQHPIGYQIYNQKILFYNELKRKKYEALLNNEYNDFIKLDKEIKEFETLISKKLELKEIEEKFPPYKYAALNLTKYIKYSLLYCSKSYDLVYSNELVANSIYYNYLSIFKNGTILKLLETKKLETGKNIINSWKETISGDYIVESLGNLCQLLYKIISEYISYYYLILRYGSYQLKVNQEVISEIKKLTGEDITDIFQDDIKKRTVDNTESRYYSKHLPRVKYLLKKIILQRSCQLFDSLRLKTKKFTLHVGDIDACFTGTKLSASLTSATDEIKTTLSLDTIRQQLETYISREVFQYIDSLGTNTDIDSHTKTDALEGHFNTLKQKYPYFAKDEDSRYVTSNYEQKLSKSESGNLVPEEKLSTKCHIQQEQQGGSGSDDESESEQQIRKTQDEIKSAFSTPESVTPPESIKLINDIESDNKKVAIIKADIRKTQFHQSILDEIQDKLTHTITYYQKTKGQAEQLLSDFKNLLSDELLDMDKFMGEPHLLLPNREIEPGDLSKAIAMKIPEEEFNCSQIPHLQTYIGKNQAQLNQIPSFSINTSIYQYIYDYVVYRYLNKLSNSYYGKDLGDTIAKIQGNLKNEYLIFLKTHPATGKRLLSDRNQLGGGITHGDEIDIATNNGEYPKDKLGYVGKSVNADSTTDGYGFMTVFETILHEYKDGSLHHHENIDLIKEAEYQSKKVSDGLTIIVASKPQKGQPEPNSIEYEVPPEIPKQDAKAKVTVVDVYINPNEMVLPYTSEVLSNFGGLISTNDTSGGNNLAHLLSQTNALSSLIRHNIDDIFTSELNSMNKKLMAEAIKINDYGKNLDCDLKLPNIFSLDTWLTTNSGRVNFTSKDNYFAYINRAELGLEQPIIDTLLNIFYNSASNVLTLSGFSDVLNPSGSVNSSFSYLSNNFRAIIYHIVASVQDRNHHAVDLSDINGLPEELSRHLSVLTDYVKQINKAKDKLTIDLPGKTNIISLINTRKQQLNSLRHKYSEVKQNHKNYVKNISHLCQRFSLLYITLTVTVNELYDLKAKLAYEKTLSDHNKGINDEKLSSLSQVSSTIKDEPEPHPEAKSDDDYVDDYLTNQYFHRDQKGKQEAIQQQQANINLNIKQNQQELASVTQRYDSEIKNKAHTISDEIINLIKISLQIIQLKTGKAADKPLDEVEAGKTKQELYDRFISDEWNMETWKQELQTLILEKHTDALWYDKITELENSDIELDKSEHPKNINTINGLLKNRIWNQNGTVNNSLYTADAINLDPIISGLTIYNLTDSLDDIDNIISNLEVNINELEDAVAKNDHLEKLIISQKVDQINSLIDNITGTDIISLIDTFKDIQASSVKNLFTIVSDEFINQIQEQCFTKLEKNTECLSGYLEIVKGFSSQVVDYNNNTYHQRVAPLASSIREKCNKVLNGVIKQNIDINTQEINSYQKIYNKIPDTINLIESTNDLDTYCDINVLETNFRDYMGNFIDRYSGVLGIGDDDDLGNKLHKIYLYLSKVIINNNDTDNEIGSKVNNYYNTEKFYEIFKTLVIDPLNKCLDGNANKYVSLLNLSEFIINQMGLDETHLNMFKALMSKEGLDSVYLNGQSDLVSWIPIMNNLEIYVKNLLNNAGLDLKHDHSNFIAYQVDVLKNETRDLVNIDVVTILKTFINVIIETLQDKIKEATKQIEGISINITTLRMTYEASYTQNEIPDSDKGLGEQLKWLSDNNLSITDIPNNFLKFSNKRYHERWTQLNKLKQQYTSQRKIYQSILDDPKKFIINASMQFIRYTGLNLRIYNYAYHEVFSKQLTATNLVNYFDDKILSSYNSINEIVINFIHALGGNPDKDIIGINTFHDNVKNNLTYLIHLFRTNAVVNFCCKKYLNGIIVGPAGAGKTTLGKTIANLYDKLGIFLKPWDGTAKTRADLIASYVGQTAPKVKSILVECTESILFVDEAYQVTGCQRRNGKWEPAGGNDYGSEAITEIVNYLDKNIDSIAVIAAGYKEPMYACWLGANEGMPRRFPNIYEIYSKSALELFTSFLLRKLLYQRYLKIKPDNKGQIARLYDIIIKAYQSENTDTPNQEAVLQIGTSDQVSVMNNFIRLCNLNILLLGVLQKRDYLKNGPGDIDNLVGHIFCNLGVNVDQLIEKLGTSRGYKELLLTILYSYEQFLRPKGGQVTVTFYKEGNYHCDRLSILTKEERSIGLKTKDSVLNRDTSRSLGEVDQEARIAGQRAVLDYRLQQISDQEDEDDYGGEKDRVIQETWEAVNYDPDLKTTDRVDELQSEEYKKSKTDAAAEGIRKAKKIATVAAATSYLDKIAKKTRADKESRKKLAEEFTKTQIDKSTESITNKERDQRRREMDQRRRDAPEERREERRITQAAQKAAKEARKLQEDKYRESQLRAQQRREQQRMDTIKGLVHEQYDTVCDTDSDQYNVEYQEACEREKIERGDAEKKQRETQGEKLMIRERDDERRRQSEQSQLQRQERERSESRRDRYARKTDPSGSIRTGGSELESSQDLSTRSLISNNSDRSNRYAKRFIKYSKLLKNDATNQTYQYKRDKYQQLLDNFENLSFGGAESKTDVPPSPDSTQDANNPEVNVSFCISDINDANKKVDILITDENILTLKPNATGYINEEDAQICSTQGVNKDNHLNGKLYRFNGSKLNGCCQWNPKLKICQAYTEGCGETLKSYNVPCTYYTYTCELDGTGNRSCDCEISEEETDGVVTHQRDEAEEAGESSDPGPPVSKGTFQHDEQTDQLTAMMSGLQLKGE